MSMFTTARPYLAQVERPSVACRVTIGHANAAGIPIMRDRLFVVTATADRAAGKQQRASFLPGWDKINGTPQSPLGVKSVDLILCHADPAHTYSVRALAQSVPGVIVPGGMPFCSSADLKTARRWQDGGHVPIKCDGKDCRYMTYGTSERSPCQLTTTITAMLDVPAMGAPIPCAIITRSAVSGWNFEQMLSTARQRWEEAHTHLGLAAPEFSAYGLRVRASIQSAASSVAGQARAYPRWSFALLTPLELMITQRLQLGEALTSGTALMLPPAQDIHPDVEEAALAELLPPEQPTEADLLERLREGSKLSHTQMQSLLRADLMTRDEIQLYLPPYLRQAETKGYESMASMYRAYLAEEDVEC